MALGAFDEAAAFEAGSGADEGDEVGCVHGPPPWLGGLDELEDHGECGGAGAGASGDLGPQAHGRELDSIGFVVRRWIQCSAGKSKNASSSS